MDFFSSDFDLRGDGDGDPLKYDYGYYIGKITINTMLKIATMIIKQSMATLITMKLTTISIMKTMITMLKMPTKKTMATSIPLKTVIITTMMIMITMTTMTKN